MTCSGVELADFLSEICLELKLYKAASVQRKFAGFILLVNIGRACKVLMIFSIICCVLVLLLLVSVCDAINTSYLCFLSAVHAFILTKHQKDP